MDGRRIPRHERRDRRVYTLLLFHPGQAFEAGRRHRDLEVTGTTGTYLDLGVGQFREDLLLELLGDLAGLRRRLAQNLERHDQ